MNVFPSVYTSLNKNLLDPIDAASGGVSAGGSGSSGPIDPLTLNPLLWLDANDSTTRFTDRAGTLAASSDGDNLRAWRDKASSVLYASPADGNAATLKLNRAGGLASAKFNGTSSYLSAGNNSTLNGIYAGNYTLVWVLQTDRVNTFQFFFNKATGASRFDFVVNSSGASFYQRFNVFDGPTVASIPVVLAYTYNATGPTEKWFVNGVEAATRTGAIAAVETAASWVVGARSNGTFFWPGEFSEAFMFPSLFDSSALLEFQTTYINRRYSPQIVYHGNSLTAGTGATGPSAYYPAVANATLGLSEKQGLNVGSAGQTLLQMVTSAPSIVDPSRFGATPVLLCWELTNSLAVTYATDGAAVTKTYADLQTYCNARRTAGWDGTSKGKIAIGTCLDRSTGVYTGQNGTFRLDRNALNALIRADFSVATSDARIFLPTPGVTYADLMFDVGADPTIGGDGANSNGTYFTDGIHLTDAGYVIVANDYAVKAINQLTSA